MKNRLKITLMLIGSFSINQYLNANEINITGKNVYIENEENLFHQICLETENQDKKILVNNTVGKKICVNFNPKLKFLVLNVKPDSSENIKFKIEFKQKAIFNIPGFNGEGINSFYLGDEDEKGNTMILNYKKLEEDTVITLPDFNDTSSKLPINHMLLSK